MKRILTAIAALVLAITSMSAQRLTNINVEAQFITDKMMAELGLSSAQRASILQLNLSYLGGITSYRDIDSKIWKTRNSRLKAMLTTAQWRRYKDSYYFYRPIGWKDGAYVHNIYAKYPKPAKEAKYGKRKNSKCDKQWRKDRRRRDEWQKNNKERRRQQTFGSRR